MYIVNLKPFSPTQVSARTESSIRKRNQAMPRTFSKRRSRFSSLWGLDTTSKRKTTGHPSISQASFRLRCPLVIAVCALRFDPSVIYWSPLQVFVDGMEPAKKPLARMFEDSASEKSVRAHISLFLDFLLVKFRCKVEHHCECCLSCKAIRKTTSTHNSSFIVLKRPS